MNASELGATGILQFRRHRPLECCPYGGEEQDGADWQEDDPDPRVPSVDPDAAQEEASGDQDTGRGEQRPSGSMALGAPIRKLSGGEREGDMDQSEERSVRMRQSPHQASRVIGDVEIPADFKSMKHLEEDSER